MRKFNLAWIVAISLVSTTCRDNKPLSPKDKLQQAAKLPGINAGSGTFDIQAPAGWKKIEKKMSGLSFTLLLAPKTAGAPFQSNISVLSKTLPGDAFDKFFEGVVSGAEQTMQILEKGSKDINGHSSKWVRYSGVSNGRQLDAITYAIPGDNGIVYVLTCGAPKGTMEKYQTEFDEAINSFQVHGMIKVSK